MIETKTEQLSNDIRKIFRMFKTANPSVLRTSFCLAALSLQLVGLCLLSYKVSLGFFGFGLILTVGLVMKSNEPATAPDRSQIPVQVFQEMDRRDENQILAEMRGELLEEFVYSIRIDGRDVTNLSYAGIKEAIRRHGQIEILEVRKEEDDKEYRVLVRVRDHVNSIDVLGAATAEKNKPFAWVLAHNKAERNAFSKLLPAKLYAALIQEWLTQYRGKVRGETKESGTHEPLKDPVPTASNPEPQSVRFPGEPEQGSLSAVTDEILASELDKLPWRPNKSGKEGWNVRWSDVPQQFRAKLGLKLNETSGKRYVGVGDYSYRRYGDENEWLARYKGTKTSEHVPVEGEPRPDQRTWKVPVLKDFASADLMKQGLQQFPLGRDLQSFGMVNVLDDEFSLVPEKPVQLDTAIVNGFLIRKIVEPLAAKHHLEYTIQRTTSGLLEAILIRGKLQDEQVKGLVSGARWAFARSLEEKKS